MVERTSNTPETKSLRSMQLLRHWKFLAMGIALGMGAAWLWVGFTNDAAQVTLIRSSGGRDVPISAVLDVLRSPELVSLTPNVRVETIGAELIRISVDAHGRAQNGVLADRFAKAAIQKLQSLQREESQALLLGLEPRLKQVQHELEGANQKLAAFQSATGTYDLDAETSALVRQDAELEGKRQDAMLQLASVGRQIESVQAALTDHHPALLAARQAVDRSALRYTDEHPKMQELRANVESIRARLLVATNQVDPEVALSSSSLAKDLYAQFIDLRTRRANLASQIEQIAAFRGQVRQKLSALPEKRLEYARLSTAYESLKSTYAQLIQQRQAAEASAVTALTPFRIHAPAYIRAAPVRWFHLLGGAMLGLLGTGAFATLRDLFRRRIRSEADLERATHLPILAALGDLNKMSARDKEQWAFETFTHLKGTLMDEQTQTLMCGFISSQHGEGRSTCISLLADAAAKQGYRTRVLTTNRTSSAAQLPAPAEIPEALASACPAPLAIPLPGWVWNKELREQWQIALTEIKTVKNLVTFVELPPACEPEGILLAEKFSPLIWLAARDRANIRQTRSHLEMLRCAGTRFAGAVFNNATGPRRWFAALLLLAALEVHAQTPDQPAVEEQPPAPLTNAFSVVSPSNIAQWQKRLTLGPGDVLNISLYEQPDTLRANVTIAPDGTINYLQARNVQATGLTVDELREKLESTLLKFYQPPLRVVVHPQAYNSKKAYLLGNVANGGILLLDRPITVLEAVARARGFVRSPLQQSMPALAAADFSRSFLVRKGPTGQYARVPVDFESLFVRADLSQNVALAPDDYLYFPGLDLQEVYVLGDAVRPGPVQLVPELSVTRAIALRGGFTSRAYRAKVLVVRGSLKNPQTFVINTSDVLAAKAADLKLQPRDIVYISRKPWYRVEELLENAILAFVGSAAITAAGQNVGPFITEPLF
jgi:polysaccharide biosynthesis/export protein